MNEESKILARVVSREDLDGEIWKSVPYFQNSEVSNKGRVRNIHNGVIVKQSEVKTSVGTYLNVGARNTWGPSFSNGVHVLVCLAFKGTPPEDDKRYEVNHIDGDKHNNLPDNLEWNTRSQNTLHALKNGLRYDNLVVKVKDITTNEEKEYYSISEAARQFNLPREKIKQLLYITRSKPHLDRFVFELDKTRLGVINRSSYQNEVIAKDYVTGMVIHSSDATEMQYHTGVKNLTISAITGNRESLRKNPDKLIAGYVFRRRESNDSFTNFPVYSVEQAQTSRDSYFGKDIPAKNVPIIVKDYVTGAIIEYPSARIAAEKCGYSYNEINKRTKEKNIKLIKGKVYKKAGDNTPWPDYAASEIEHSLVNRLASAIMLDVTDTVIDTTKRYNSIAEFAKTIGKDPDSFGNVVKRFTGRLFNDRYKMVMVNR